MKLKRIKMPSPAMAVALTALFVALGTAAYAGTKLPANSVGAKQLKPNAVTESDVAPSAITAPKIAAQAVDSGQLKPGAVSSGKLQDNAVTAEKLGVLPAVRVTRSTPQTVPPLSPVPVTWNTETFDTANLHNNTTNTERLTAPVAGIYDIRAHVDWAADAEGFRNIVLVKSDNSTPDYRFTSPIDGTNPTSSDVEATVPMAAGDFVIVIVQQQSWAGIDPPTTLDILSDSNFKPKFEMRFVAPAS